MNTGGLFVAVGMGDGVAVGLGDGVGDGGKAMFGVGVATTVGAGVGVGAALVGAGLGVGLGGGVVVGVGVGAVLGAALGAGLWIGAVRWVGVAELADETELEVVDVGDALVPGVGEALTDADGLDVGLKSAVGLGVALTVAIAAAGDSDAPGAAPSDVSEPHEIDATAMRQSRRDAPTTLPWRRRLTGDRRAVASPG